MKILPPSKSKQPTAWEMTARELQHSTPGVSAHIWHSPRNGTTYITNLSVQHDKRGQGVGTEYMQKVSAAADEHGQALELGVQRPELQPWYERLGFREVGTNPVMGTMLRRDPAPRS